MSDSPVSDGGRRGAGPPSLAPTGAPSTFARVLGFAAIVAAGAAGGFIGYAITDLQCDGDCGTNAALGGLAGAVIAAVGVAIVVVLALRAMGEWKQLQAAGGDQRRRDAPTGPGTTTRPRPRVR